MADALAAAAVGGGEPNVQASPATLPVARAAMQGRGEVDTSSPFESVRQAVDLFGGSAASPWRPPQAPPLHLRPEEIELMKVEERTVKLEMELFVKEKETFKVLKELQTTKQVIDGLKLQIENVTSQAAQGAKVYTDTMKVYPLPDIEQKSSNHIEPLIQSTNRKQSPVTTLMELKHAKAYLNRNTVKTLKGQIEEEKASLEITRERLRLNTAKASSLEENLNKIVAQLEALKGAKPILEPSDIWLQMKQLNSEKEKFKKMTDDSKYEISELTAAVELTRSKMKTVQFRILMAEKLKDAAKSGEALALAEMKTLSNGQDLAPVTSNVTLSLEDHSTLTRKAQEADDTSRKKIEAAMQEVEGANQSKLELLERVEEAMADVETSRKALEEALKREEAANKAKVAAEETLRRLRSEQISQNWRPVNNSTKFKNSAATTRRAGSGIFDVNGMSLVTSGPRNTRTMSIGQILSRKLVDGELEAGKNTNGKKKVSLGQILSQKYEVYSPLRIDDGTAHKQFPRKRKKLGFVVFALLLARQKKKKQACSNQGSFSTKVV